MRRYATGVICPPDQLADPLQIIQRARLQVSLDSFSKCFLMDAKLVIQFLNPSLVVQVVA